MYGLVLVSAFFMSIVTPICLAVEPLSVQYEYFEFDRELSDIEASDIQFAVDNLQRNKRGEAYTTLMLDTLKRNAVLLKHASVQHEIRESPSHNKFEVDGFVFETVSEVLAVADGYSVNLRVRVFSAGTQLELSKLGKIVVNSRAILGMGHNAVRLGVVAATLKKASIPDVAANVQGENVR